MPYILTREELGSITAPEMAFGATRLLPAMADIPQEFQENYDRNNPYVELVNALMYGNELPECKMIFKVGFDDEQAPSDLNKCVRAHLQSFGPKHEHKTAGVAYMISCVCELQQAALAA